MVAFCPSIASFVGQCILSLTSVGDAVLVMNPVYSFYMASCKTFKRQPIGTNLQLKPSSTRPGLVRF